MDDSGYQCLRVSLQQGVARVRLDNGPVNLLDKPLFKELLRLTDPPAADAPLSPFHRMAGIWRTMPKATIAVVEDRVGGGGAGL